LANPLYQKVKKCIEILCQSNEIIEGSRMPNEDELKDIDNYLKEEELA
jgi:hypothetical protein